MGVSVTSPRRQPEADINLPGRDTGWHKGPRFEVSRVFEKQKEAKAVLLSAKVSRAVAKDNEEVGRGQSRGLG